MSIFAKRLKSSENSSIVLNLRLERTRTPSMKRKNRMSASNEKSKRLLKMSRKQSLTEIFKSSYT
jgi:hypothetical protein